MVFFDVMCIIVFSALLLFGLIQCKKQSFSGGFYFFLFMIIDKIYSLIYSMAAPPLIKNFVDHATNPLPAGMTLGGVIALISYANYSIDYIFMIIAFSFLIIGMYRMWKIKSSP
jgi:hypothetical protein